MRSRPAAMIGLYAFAARTGGACYFPSSGGWHYRYHRGSLSTSVATDVATRIGKARAALYYWNDFLRDGGVAETTSYFEVKRGLNALAIVAYRLRLGEARAAMAELVRFLRHGLIHPRLVRHACGCAAPASRDPT